MAETGYAPALANWPIDRALPKPWLIEGPSGLTSQYQLVGRIEYYGPEGEFIDYKTISVKTDRLTPPENMDEIVHEYAERYMPLGAVSYTLYHVVGAKFRPG